MKFKYVLNLNANHKVDHSQGKFGKITDVFTNNLTPFEYKNQDNLKRICKGTIRSLEDKYIDMGNTNAIGFDEPVYIIYSGLAVVMLTFVGELIKEGYKPIVLFEDKDNGGYYKMEADY